ncbi:hypothetical protein BV378_36550 [Nostoc sp. RF31YmG]|nr:hypothetical protein BV378_36550 [Nostoc sp. RF31YmG]
MRDFADCFAALRFVPCGKAFRQRNEVVKKWDAPIKGFGALVFGCDVNVKKKVCEFLYIDLESKLTPMNLQIQPELELRRINFEFPEQIERYWFGKSAFKTHLLNSLTILLPDIEQYLIHNIKNRIKQIGNPQLKQQAQAFIGQEAQHSQQHSKFWDNLHFFGYKFDAYLHFLQAILFKALESRLSISLNLSISAGIEHLTTLIAEYALESDFMAEAEPNLKQLFEWHAVEEIEHKTVVYDVFQNRTKNYLIRIVGLFISNILVLFFLIWGLVILLYQDKKLLDRKVWQESIDFFFTKDKFFYRVLLNSIDYFRKGFHPSQKNNLFLI